jgi:hypothetical protein
MTELKKVKVHIIKNGNWQGLTGGMEIDGHHVHKNFDLADVNVIVRRKKMNPR